MTFHPSRSGRHQTTGATACRPTMTCRQATIVATAVALKVLAEAVDRSRDPG